MSERMRPERPRESLHTKLIRKILTGAGVPKDFKTDKDQRGDLERYSLFTEEALRRGANLNLDLEKILSLVNEFLTVQETKDAKKGWEG